MSLGALPGIRFRQDVSPGRALAMCPEGNTMARFGTVLTAMITPFDDAGELDVDVAARLARWLVDQGNQGLVVAGTTGESPTITHEEQARLFRPVREAVPVPGGGRRGLELHPGVARAGRRGRGRGGRRPAGRHARTTTAPRRPACSHHFRTVAERADLPVMLYDIPVRTGRKIETATLVELAHTVPNIVALKDAAGDPAETARFIAEAPDGFDVYSGDDSHDPAPAGRGRRRRGGRVHPLVRPPRWPR